MVLLSDFETMSSDGIKPWKWPLAMGTTKENAAIIITAETVNFFNVLSPSMMEYYCKSYLVALF